MAASPWGVAGQEPGGWGAGELGSWGGIQGGLLTSAAPLTVGAGTCECPGPASSWACRNGPASLCPPKAQKACSRGLGWPGPVPKCLQEWGVSLKPLITQGTWYPRTSSPLFFQMRPPPRLLTCFFLKAGRLIVRGKDDSL